MGYFSLGEKENWRINLGRILNDNFLVVLNICCLLKDKNAIGYINYHYIYEGSSYVFHV